MEPEYREFIPAIQLAVCLDRQGKYVEATRYNELASYYKPDSEAVKQNRIYFEGFEIISGVSFKAHMIRCFFPFLFTPYRFLARCEQ